MFWPGRSENGVLVMESLVGDIVCSLIEKAFDQSLPIIGTLPKGAIQESAIEIYYGKLYVNNPEQARAWLDGLEHGRFRDVASQGVVETALASNPELAARIARGIGGG